MLIKFDYQTKYNTDKLEIIYKNIKYYKSNIYNQKNILYKINKKKQLIKSYIFSIEELDKLKHKVIFTYLSLETKNKIKERIIDLTYKITILEENINFIEWEENMIMKTFNIKNNDILNCIIRLIY
jgi:hypothetical protein